MAQRIFGDLPDGWVKVDVSVVYDNADASTDFPKVDYWYYATDYYVAPKDVTVTDPIRSQVLDEAKGLINGDRA